MQKLAKHSKLDLPESLEDFVGLEKDEIRKLEIFLERVSKHDLMSISYSIEDVKLLAPIRYPPKIVCLGLNYRDHAVEQNVAVPDEPILFMKPRTAIIGPNEEIVKPSFVKQLDYEAELAIVVGRKVKSASAKQARSCIFGYTILNDVSARDIQFKDKQWTRSKSFDTFAPMGSCIATEDQVPDTSDLHIRTWVNEEIRQDSSTKNMIFNVCEIIRRVSLVMTLEPCDIISTGTPAGVGFAMKPVPKFLDAGDVVKIEIEKIGTLQNKVT